MVWANGRVMGREEDLRLSHIIPEELEESASNQACKGCLIWARCNRENKVFILCAFVSMYQALPGLLQPVSWALISSTALHTLTIKETTEPSAELGYGQDHPGFYLGFESEADGPSLLRDLKRYFEDQSSAITTISKIDAAQILSALPSTDMEIRNETWRLVEGHYICTAPIIPVPQFSGVAGEDVH